MSNEDPHAPFTARAGYASDWHRRKAERTSLYWGRHGCKLVTCTACNGSGYYDARNSPKCDCCGGTGRCRERHNKPELSDGGKVQ